MIHTAFDLPGHRQLFIDILTLRRCNCPSMQLVELPDKRIDTIMTKDYKVVCIQVCR